jgi:hypothetical protein
VKEVRLGVGHHTSAIFADPVLAANFSRIIETSWLQAFLNLTAIFFVKMPAGLFLLRLVQGTGHKVRTSPTVSHILMLINYSALLFLLWVGQNFSKARKFKLTCQCYTIPVHLHCRMPRHSDISMSPVRVIWEFEL